MTTKLRRIGISETIYDRLQKEADRRMVSPNLIAERAITERLKELEQEDTTSLG
jgi:predicted transcriptional regulator